MAKRAWTGGPWQIAGPSHVFAAGPNGANICSVSEPRATKVVGYTKREIESPDWDEASANARLISAAPDLYEALQTALHALDDLADKGEAMTRGLAALTKAEEH